MLININIDMLIKIFFLNEINNDIVLLVISLKYFYNYLFLFVLVVLFDMK